MLIILILSMNFSKIDVFSAPKFALWTDIFRQEDIVYNFSTAKNLGWASALPHHLPPCHDVGASESNRIGFVVSRIANLYSKDRTVTHKREWRPSADIIYSRPPISTNLPNSLSYPNPNPNTILWPSIIFWTVNCNTGYSCNQETLMSPYRTDKETDGRARPVMRPIRTAA